MYSVKNRHEFGILLKELNLNGNGIEIGVCNGEFSDSLIKNTELKRIYLLDAWKNYSKTEYRDKNNVEQAIQDDRYNKIVERMKIHGDRVVIIRKDSNDGVSDFEDNFFDFVYIDANHDYKHVRDDVTNWYPKVKLGGIIAGHDYKNKVRGDTIMEVKKAVDEYFDKLNVKVLITPGICPSWYIIKK